MIYPSADKIDKQIESKYALVVLAAKRTKQLKEGGRPVIQTDSPNPLTVALEEIAEGAISYRFDENSLAGREALADKQAVVGARDIEVEGLDPLALPDDLVARAASQLGANLTEAALLDDEDGEEMEEEEDEVPLLMAEDDVEEPEV